MKSKSVASAPLEEPNIVVNGVTMPERGVSQLVSVDLQGVSHLRAIA